MPLPVVLPDGYAPPGAIQSGWVEGTAVRRWVEFHPDIEADLSPQGVDLCAHPNKVTWLH